MIIASRILKLQASTGTIPVLVNIFLPHQDDDGGWICAYEIHWPDKPWNSAAGGMDSMQALLCAMQKIGLELYFSDSHKAGKLNWNSDWSGFGLPVPQNARDILIGEDAKFL